MYMLAHLNTGVLWPMDRFFPGTYKKSDQSDQSFLLLSKVHSFGVHCPCCRTKYIKSLCPLTYGKGDILILVWIPFASVSVLALA